MGLRNQSHAKDFPYSTIPSACANEGLILNRRGCCEELGGIDESDLTSGAGEADCSGAYG